MKKVITYDEFIRGGLSRMFTDDQINFLWGMFAEWEPEEDSN